MTELLHARIITPSQGAGAELPFLCSQVFLAASLAGKGPGPSAAATAWRKSRVPPPSGFIRLNNGPERLEKCSCFPGLAPGAGLGWTPAWEALSPLRDLGRHPWGAWVCVPQHPPQAQGRGISPHPHPYPFNKRSSQATGSMGTAWEHAVAVIRGRTLPTLVPRPGWWPM